MKVDDRGWPTALFEIRRVDFQIAGGSQGVADFGLHQVTKEYDPSVVRIRLHVFFEHFRALCHSPQVEKQERLGTFRSKLWISLRRGFIVGESLLILALCLIYFGSPNERRPIA